MLSPSARELSLRPTPRPANWSRRWRAPGLAVGAALGMALFAAPRSLLAQTVTTVGETKFRSRWSNYQLDRPREDVPPALRPEAGAAPRGTSLRSFFQNGPVVLRAALVVGWEYSDQQAQTISVQSTPESSPFAAAAIALLYDREVGPWGVSARYSAGYLYYLDQNFAAAADAGRGLSQTGGLDILRKGTRLLLRSATSGASGSGYDIERGEETTRVNFGQGLSAEYQVSEFIKVGATGKGAYASYDSGTPGSDNSQTQFSGNLFADYFWTGKTGFHVEAGAGRESQDVGTGPGYERSYSQGLIGINYQPTAKLKFRAGLGVGVLDQSGSTSPGTENNGSRTIYSLDADYTPTEKLAARLHFGLDGTSVEPEFSLALNWHPREFTFVHLSIYQQTGLSTISFAQDQTRRGVLGTVRQRFFQRLDANLSAGIEQQELTNAGDSQSGQTNDPYSYFAATLAWEINQWLAWQVQYIRSSGRDSSFGAQDQPQTRVATSIRLTF